MSIPRFQQSQSKPLRSTVKKIHSKEGGSELSARGVEVKPDGISKLSAQNYTKTETPSKSLLARPVRVASMISEDRLPAPEVVENLELKQSLMLLQPGATKEHTQKALDILDVCLKNGDRAPDARDELYKAAELIFEGKIASENKLVAASRLIYLAERLDGWKAPGRLAEFDKSKHEFVGKIYSEIEKHRTQKMLFGEYIDPATNAAYQACESVFQVSMLSEAYLAFIDPSQTIDEMQFRIEWAFQGFFIYYGPQDRAVYFNKINESITDGSITQDQLKHHFELLEHAIKLGFMKADDPHALNDLLGLRDTIKVLLAVGNIKMALFALGNRLLNVNNFNLNHYMELLGIVEDNLVIALEKNDEPSIEVLSDELKYLSKMTLTVNLDRYSYGRHVSVLKNIEKLIDDKLKDDPKNENLIKAKLKMLGAEIHFSMEYGKQFEYAKERHTEDLKRFFNKSNLKDPKLLLKKLQWAVDEGVVFFSDIFEKRAEDLLYGIGIEKPEPEMAANFFALAAKSKLGTLPGLRRAIIEMRANSIDEDIIKVYEKQFEELLELQQKAISQAGREKAQEILDIADILMEQGDFLGASINYLLLEKSNLSSPFDVFGIWSENKRVRVQIAKLADKFSKSEIEEDRLWGKQLKKLFNLTEKK